MQNGWTRLAALGCVIGIALTATGYAAEPPIRVGLYNSAGMQGVQAALDAEPRIETATINTLDADALFAFDVVVLGSVKGVPQRAWMDAMKIYTQSGGGVLLHHDATGFRGWSDSAFPEHFKGENKSRTTSMRVVAEHPITRGVAESFQHAYFDHITLEARHDGTVLVEDADGRPVVVAGTIEHGRVVGNGMITGYAYAGREQREQAPTGGERTILLNAIHWLADGRLTQLDEAELSKRRSKFEADVALRNAAEMERVDAQGVGAHGDRTSWYYESMLTEQGYIHPPVHVLDGRFFMFDGVFCAMTNRKKVGREYGETLALVQQMKWAGVTDIITHSGGPVMKFRYPTQLPDVEVDSRAHAYGFDYLDRLCKAANECGLNVWGFWHPSRGGPYKISDPSGEPYGNLLDIKDPRVLEAAKRCLDELAERYTTYGNFKGVFLDELWHPFVYDRMEGQVDNYIAFCEKQFGETPPADLDLAAKFGRGRDWHDVDSKWWRRYVLFRNTFTVDFIREVTAYANKVGLKTMPQIGFGFDWFQGHGDTYNLTRAGDMLWTYEHRNTSRYEHYPLETTICATHTRSPGGYQLVAPLRGLAGSQFAFEQTWLPIGFGKNPRAVEIFERQVRTSREWYGAQTLSRFAVLTNRIGLDLSQPEAKRAFTDNEEALQLALSTVRPTAMLMVRDTAIYPQYKALVAPRHALEYLPDHVYAQLVDYVEDGGNLIVLGSTVSTSRHDHTNVVDRTADLTGIAPGDDPVDRRHVAFDLDGETFDFPSVDVRRAAPSDGVTVLTAADGMPLITERQRGAGRVTTVHFDVTSQLHDATASPTAVRLLCQLLDRTHRPAIRVEGDVVIYAAARKGDWVVIGFLPPGSRFDTTLGKQVPASGKLHIDMKQLGIEADRFKVINLARDREMMPQGDDWDFFGREYWTQQSLSQQGVDVYIPPNSLEDLDLPSKITNEYVTKYILPRWPSRARAYEHDIIAIAPADKPFPTRDPTQ